MVSLTGYTFEQARWHETYEELMPLYRMHYDEYRERMAHQGIPLPEMALRMDVYVGASQRGEIIHVVARKDGIAVGYVTVFISNDMHNGDRIMREDTLFVHPDHRRGVGKRLARIIFDAGAAMGAKRLHMSAATDPRATAQWVRMGAIPAAVGLVYVF